MPDGADATAPAPASPPSELARQLDRYLRHVAIELGRSSHTVAAYGRDLRAVLDAASGRGATTPSDLTTTLIEDVVRSFRERPEPLAPASIARTLSSVRGFSRFLVDEGLLVDDPARELVAPKLPSRLPKALTVDQMQRVLAATDGDDPIAIRDKALLELLYATGARISEAVALNVDDLAGEDGIGEVVRLFGKGGKQRIVPVGSYARAALEAYLVRVRPILSSRGKATPALLLGARGARLSRQNAWLIVRAAAAVAKLEVELSPHSFRHSFATHLLEGGADVRVVQELLGHASVATTQIYTKVTADALRDVYIGAHPRAR